MTGLGMEAKAHYGKYKPYGDDPHHHNTQGSTKRITVTGRFIASSNSTPQALERTLKSKSPVRFTMATGESERVVVTDYHMQRKNFVTHSGAVMQDFTVTMERVSGGGFGLMSILGGILALF